MTERNRAWRRRKTHFILSKIEKTKEWITHQFKDKSVKKPIPALKQHRHDALTHKQDAKLHLALNDEIHDRAWYEEAA